MSRRLFPPAQNTASKAHKLRDERKGRRSRRSRPLGCHIEYSWHKLSRSVHALVCWIIGSAFSDNCAVFCQINCQKINGTYSKLYSRCRNAAIIGAIALVLRRKVFLSHNFSHFIWRNKNIHGKNDFVDLKIIFFGHSNWNVFALLSTLKLLHNYFNN